MTPAQLQAWIVIAQQLASVGISLYTTIEGWITQAHPTLTPDQIQSAFAAILADDNVRIAIAQAATPPTPAA